MMNKRILKLAKKSGATVNEGYDGTKNFVYGITMSPEELEKFAELIVSECATICNKIYFDNYPDAEDFERSEEGDAIKKHFGVEE